VVAADQTGFKAAFDRLKKIDGYRWLVINRDDLFVANTLSSKTKTGIVDADVAVLQAADLPRRRVQVDAKDGTSASDCKSLQEVVV
jgi:hypothetical protein